MLREELLEMLINGRSIIMWALLTVWSKLIFRKGYLDQKNGGTHCCQVLRWRDFKYAASIEKMVQDKMSCSG